MTDEKQKNYAATKKIREKAARLYQSIADGFNAKSEQRENIDDYWDIYNCKLNSNQTYDGDSQVFVPVIRDCVEARVKRRTSMLFPPVGQVIDVVSESGDIPHETIGLLEHYVRYSDLRSLVPQLLRRDDVEGQCSVEVGWETKKRTITQLKETDDPDVPGEKVIDVVTEEVVTQGPTLTAIPLPDLLILPPTAPTVQHAQSVCVIRRYSESVMEEMVEEGTFIESEFKRMSALGGEKHHPDKDRASDAGVKMKGSGKLFQVYKVWTEMKLDDKKEPVVIYFGGEDIVLGIEKNPFWSKKVPIVTAPVEASPGTIYGTSKIAPVKQLQYQLNDIINMGMDSARYSVLPIVMTDPVKNPNVGSMVLAAAAIWETNPNDTQFAQFPPLWKDAFQQAAAIKSQIMESMDTNDAMLGKAPGGRKNAQAIGAQAMEASAAISDSVRLFEFHIMDDLLEWFFEMDQQYRVDGIWIANAGPAGVQAKLQKIEPRQASIRYKFRWVGTDQAIGAQRVQQMIGFVNVLRGIPPQQLGGRRLDIGPVLEQAAGVVFGPHLAPRVLVDERHMQTIPVEMENEMLHNNLQVPISPADNDIEHIQAHQEGARLTGDPTGTFRQHMHAHAAAMQAKMQQQAPQQQGGQPGVPGGAGPGVAGTPRPGAMPAQQRPMQQPPGAVAPGQAVDAQAHT